MLRASSRSVGVPCNESQRRTALVSAPGSQVHPEQQRLETAWSGGDVRPRPLVGEVERFFTAGTVGLAAAVGVTRLDPINQSTWKETV